MATVRKKKTNKTAEEILSSTPPVQNPFGITGDMVSEIGWEPAFEGIESVSYVPTIFPYINRDMHGGLATKRIHLVHGPSRGGKTAYVLGLIRSFVDRGFMAAYVDAEHSLEKKFVEKLIPNFESRPNFVVKYPKTYEETVADVDKFLKFCARLRAKHEGFRSIVVVDSINKLQPKSELHETMRDGVGDKGAEYMSKGHQGRKRAQVNNAWLDHLTPRLADADCAFVTIAQERKKTVENVWEDDWEIKGGQALVYDSSTAVRVVKASPIYLGTEKKNHNIIGFKHRVRVWKSKVGELDGKHSDAYFYLGMKPTRFDSARDLFAIAKELDLLQASGAWFSFVDGDEVVLKAQGENKFVEALDADETLFSRLLLSVNLELGIV